MTDWMRDAACRGDDSDLFFPPESPSAFTMYRHARKVCSACPVQADCLEHALERDERHGMWGGATPKERQQLRKKRGIPKPPHRKHVASQIRDDELLRRYEALGPGSGKELAADAGVSVNTLQARIIRARRRRDAS